MSEEIQHQTEFTSYCWGIDVFDSGGKEGDFVGRSGGVGLWGKVRGVRVKGGS